MKFRKRSVAVDAVQWFPGLAVVGVRQMDPTLVFSANGKHYYLNALGHPKMFADAWIPVEADAEGNNKVLPFSFWKVSKGEERPAVAGDPLVEKYLRYARVVALPQPYGLVETSEGTKTVHPGDWVATGEDGKVSVLSPRDFEETYERAEG